MKKTPKNLLKIWAEFILTLSDAIVGKPKELVSVYKLRIQGDKRPIDQSPLEKYLGNYIGVNVYMFIESLG